MIDALIIGAGHNGLVCAAYLARAGFKVTVLEASDVTGGMASTTEFAPHHRISSPAHFLYGFDPGIAKALDLAGHGLEFAASHLPTVALDADGAHRVLLSDEASGKDLSTQDIAAYAHFNQQMRTYARLLNQIANERPPTLIDGQLKDYLTLIRTGFRVRKLGRSNMRELLRIGTMNLYDLLNESIHDPLLKGAISLDGVLGAHLGPRSPNTVLTYLMRRMGDADNSRGFALPKGGMGHLTDVLSSVAISHGVTIRTNAKVANVIINNGQTSGIELTSGEQIDARTVVSNADPKLTFKHLVGYKHLNTGFSRRVENYRMRGSSAKLHLALNDLPRFSGLDAQHQGARLIIAPDMAYIERAFDHSKYAELPPQPALEVCIPSIHDRSLAPDGHHVLSAIVQYAPHTLKHSSWSDERARFTEQLIELLEQYAPGLRRQIIHQELLTPADIEKRHLATGGHWHHGELTLDQFMVTRPFPGAAQYRTPIDGLYLCGAGSHPGGGVMGLAGHNAAITIIKDANA